MKTLVEESGINRRLWVYVATALALYFAVSSLGITTSHTSIIFGDAGEKSSVLFGEPRNTRSDEFLRGSPRIIATLRGIPIENYTPLDYTGSKDYREAQDTVIARIVRWTAPIHEIVIGELGSRLSLSIGFALQWWLSSILLLIFCPIWFLFLGRSGRAGAYCALAILCVPTNAWFSNLPAFLFANAIGAAVGFLSIGRIKQRFTNRYFCFLLVLIAGLYSGRMAWTAAQYPPWGFPIIGFVALVSALAYWDLTKLRGNVRFLVVSILAALAGIGLVWVHNRTLYSVTLDTVYPGRRRDVGGSNGSSPWSGSVSWFLQSKFARNQGTANPEYALGPTFLLIPVILLLAQRRERPLSVDENKRPLFLGGFWILILLAWAQYKWPSLLLNNLNPLRWIPVGRASQIVGVLVLPLVFLLVGQRSRDLGLISRKGAGLTAVLVALLAGGGINELKNLAFPTADNAVVLWSALFTMLVTYAFLRFRQFDLRVLGLLSILVSSSILVNPVTRGLGAYDDSKAVTTVLELAKRNPRGRWASTGFFEDALMTSTGVAQLSGQQPLGPNVETWKILDPESKFESVWNRGQAYVNFAWDGRPEWTIWNPSPDVIQVVIDPCLRRLSRLQLVWVISINPIDFPCLTRRAVVTWMGNQLNIYERQRTRPYISTETRKPPTS